MMNIYLIYFFLCVSLCSILFISVWFFPAEGPCELLFSFSTKEDSDLINSIAPPPKSTSKEIEEKLRIKDVLG